MTRQAVRELKRVIHREPDGPLARKSALSLLARSVLFGHGRLAVIRLGMAVHAGADVPPEHWDYCRRAAEACRDTTVKGLFLAAAQQAGVDLPTATH
ncbi:MAG: hypothetical protein JNJ89_18630 [Rubrivivax sp.]|nr:hypothetical protein [Rubrivivax sp.]